MTLEELFTRCGESSADDWNTVTTWGARSGPSYLDHFLPVESGQQDGTTQYELRHQEHSMRAAFKPDLAVGIAWGLYADPALSNTAELRVFNEDWATQFPDKEATMHLLDFFYMGTLVDRQYYVNVDARCNLPVPKQEFEGDLIDAKLKALTITAWQRDFFRVLNALESAVDYDSYLGRVGFEIRP